VIGFEITNFYLKRCNLTAEDDREKNDKCRIAIHEAGISALFPVTLQGQLVYWLTYLTL
jgi:hypothetical protein